MQFADTTPIATLAEVQTAYAPLRIPGATPSLDQFKQVPMSSFFKKEADGGLLVGNGKFVPSGSEVAFFQMTPARRGELLLIPNDSGGLDQDAGGELTLLAYDTRIAGREFGTGNNAVGVVYIHREGGVAKAMRLRTIAIGTQPALPIYIDSTGGEINFKFNTDGTTWGQKAMQLGGLPTPGNPDAPGTYAPACMLRIGHSMAPALTWTTAAQAGAGLGFAQSGARSES
jgi:hypothetical protein